MNVDPQYTEAIDNVVKNEERARAFALTVMLHVKGTQNADTGQCTILDVAHVDGLVELIMKLAISNNEDDCAVITAVHAQRVIINPADVVLQGPPPVQRAVATRTVAPGAGRPRKFLCLPK